MIRLNIDVTNPGQFFACCGLLELADRLWPGAEGWFEKGQFCIACRGAAADLVDQLMKCTLTNTMTAQQLCRFKELSSLSKKEREEMPGSEEEKASLEKLRREEPILLHDPFGLQVDWFHDDRAGGNRFKTWAGRQSVLDIAGDMKKAIESDDWRTRQPDHWLTHSVSGCGLPFNFDSNLGGQGSALDVGFSFDPLAGSDLTRIEPTARPFLELLAFVGLQRFRPRQIPSENRFVYCAWNRPLTPEIASPAASGALPIPSAKTFEFRLLYRTKYLKSFLPAQPFSGDFDE